MERVMARGKATTALAYYFRLSAVRPLCPMLQNAAFEPCEDHVPDSANERALVELGQV
jgi:hypothetical protein